MRATLSLKLLYSSELLSRPGAAAAIPGISEIMQITVTAQL